MSDEVKGSTRAQKRVLTALLEQAGRRTVPIAKEGLKKRARNKVLADLVWEVITQGRCEMPDGTIFEVSSREWVDMVRWIYNHTDGPPKTELDVSSLGKSLAFKVYAGFDEEEV